MLNTSDAASSIIGDWSSVSITSTSAKDGPPKSSAEAAEASSTIGNALIAASQLLTEKLAEGDSCICACIDVSVRSGSIMIEVSSLDGVSTSARGAVEAGFAFSGVGQMPSCSYRSKKLELVGGDLKLMLVDLDLGRSTAPEALRCIVAVDPSCGLYELGVGGRERLGAEMNGELGVERGVVTLCVLTLLPPTTEVEPDESEAPTIFVDEADGDRKNMLEEVGK